ncbi:MAG TPA: hypothetical protein VGN79_04145 [Devosia sp.]|nr:hypothetical protein [Devosia sp.]
MNTANLQLEGLLLAIASINRALVDKGILSQDELDHALATCESSATGSDRSTEDLSPSNRDAIAFPLRFLRLANGRAGPLEFGSLAKEVGQTKGRYNDQI